MNEDAFFEEFFPDKEWLENALKRLEEGKSVRVTFVVKDSGPRTKHKLTVRPGRTDKCWSGRGPGDITAEPFYPKEEE